MLKVFDPNEVPVIFTNKITAMITRAWLTIFSLLSIATCCGQATLLWKIECDSCPETSYLMGTNHGFDGDYLFEYKELAAIAYTVDAIAIESDRSMLKNMMNHDDSLISGVPLSALLDTADYNLVKKKIESVFKMPFSLIEKYDPQAVEQSIQ